MIDFNGDRTEVTLGPGKFEFTYPVKFGVLPDTNITGIACSPLALDSQEEISEEDLEAEALADEIDDDLEDDDEEDGVELPPSNA